LGTRLHDRSGAWLPRACFAAGADDTIYSGAFADNAASLRVQEKVGFVRDGECMLYAQPRREKFPHINTVLTREAFASTRSNRGAG
jgi:RimJ/RimL family protein N-acetyltransferase